MIDRAGQRAHDWQAEDYAAYWVTDAESRDPDRAAQLALLADLLPRPAGRSPRVLDLGAGYGAVTAAVLARHPDAHVTLLDYSDAMLDHARARLATHAAQLDYALGDLTRPDWTAALAAPVDAVVSASVLHNLEDGPRIAAIYAEITRCLAPGGVFLNLDHLRAGGPRVQAQFAALRGARRPADAPAALASPAADAPLRFPADLETHLAWLRAAGFVEVECFWKHLQRALYGGYVP